MNSPSFTGSNTAENLENFNKELKKVFDVMHVTDTARWKGDRTKDAPPASGYDLKRLSWDSLSVHEYGLKFTQLSRYASKMVADMRSRMSLFVAGLSCLSSKEGKDSMLIGDMDISRLMFYVQQVEEEKLRDKEEFRNKKAKTGNKSGKSKGGLLHHLLVKLYPETKVSIMARISRTSELYLHSLKVVWNKEVTRLLHVLSVVEPTQVSVVRTRQVSSSVDKRVTS
ncbi:hypothetical protein H5410_022984 [Solanum commersonii]|uniref:Uncharacterized protein n=1 Tax=Solanum commersonii TaxID=4109 RepID=A0A9J5ZI79_SOLCO|nr:hypothetical protein H5410_022984 [Solanum commersonii]